MRAPLRAHLELERLEGQRLAAVEKMEQRARVRIESRPACLVAVARELVFERVAREGVKVRSDRARREFYEAVPKEGVAQRGEGAAGAVDFGHENLSMALWAPQESITIVRQFYTHTLASLLSTPTTYTQNARTQHAP